MTQMHCSQSNDTLE